jgi:hypothetical protein
VVFGFVAIGCTGAPSLEPETRTLAARCPAARPGLRKVYRRRRLPRDLAQGRGRGLAHRGGDLEHAPPPWRVARSTSADGGVESRPSRALCVRAVVRVERSGTGSLPIRSSSTAVIA